MHPAGRRLLGAIVGLVAVSAAWIGLAMVNVSVTAAGRVVPRDPVPALQAAEAGIVRSVSVAEGDRVAAGAPLLALDDAVARSSLALLRDQERDLGAAESRLVALLALAGIRVGDGGAWSEATPEHRHLEELRVRTEWQVHEASRGALDAEMVRVETGLAASRARMGPLEETLALLTERTQTRAVLMHRGQVARDAWLEMELQRLAAASRLQDAVASLHEQEANRVRLHRELERLAWEFQAGRLADLAEVQVRRQVVVADLDRVRRQVSRLALVAPVSGTVFQLRVGAPGSVVAIGDTLLQLVPASAVLEVEALVRNEDIASLRPGQQVRIKVSAYPFTRHGSLAGTVRWLSPDAVSSEAGTLAYVVRVAPSGTPASSPATSPELASDALSPGMAVTVEFDAGRRAVWEYLAAPLLRYREEALTEP